MRIGIDFDNTIANYDEIFFKTARELDLIPNNCATSKVGVKNFFKKNQLEDEWTKLQGYVYGQKMELVKPYDGVISFIENCQSKNIQIFIVSHKSRYPYLGPKYDLHLAAKNWLKTYPNLQVTQTYFELTLKEKIQKINALNCEYFIDDLTDVLLNKDLSQKTKKILFDPHSVNRDSKSYQRFIKWYDIEKFFR